MCCFVKGGKLEGVQRLLLTLKVAVFWDVTTCLGWHTPSLVEGLKMHAAGCVETPVLSRHVRITMVTYTAARTPNLVSCMLFSRCVSRDLDASQYVTGDMWKREQKNLTNTEVTTRGVICTPSGAELRIITVHYYAYLAPQPIASWICRAFLQECTIQEQCYVAHSVWNYPSSGDWLPRTCMRGSTGEEIVYIWRYTVEIKVFWGIRQAIVACFVRHITVHKNLSG